MECRRLLQYLLNHLNKKYHCEFLAFDDLLLKLNDEYFSFNLLCHELAFFLHYMQPSLLHV
jgi:hypothetical protein